MKKIIILFSLFLTSTYCFSQPSLGDIELEFDNISINDISGSGTPLWNSFKSNINYLFDEIDVIKSNNTPWDPTLPYVPYSHCPCGEKYVTLSLSNNSEVRFSPYITVIPDYTSNNNLTDEQQKVQAKKMLAQIMAWLAARGIDIKNVINIDILYTTTSGSGQPMVAYGFDITYKICAPCPH